MGKTAVNGRTIANYSLYAFFWLVIIFMLYFARDSIWYFALGTLFAYLGTNLVTRATSELSRTGLPLKASKVTSILLYIVTLYALFFALAFGFGHILITQIKGILELVGTSVIFEELGELLPESGNLLTLTLDNNVYILSNLLSGASELLVALFLLPFWMFYLLYDPKSISAGALRLLPSNLKEDGKALYYLTDRTIRRYLIGEAKLGFVVGSMTFLLYSLIGMPYALALGVLGLFLEFIPIYGPWILYFISLIVAFAQGWETVVLVSIAAAIIQFVEGNLLAPNIIGGKTKLRNWQVMLLVPIGGAFAGMIGMLLIIPTVVITLNFIHYIHLRLRNPKGGTVSPEVAKRIVQDESISFDDF
ncbi:MAG: AI-2E family transporter [Candidatus Dojkabacteria bacterium]|nr:MAG: AI-2E family transporter [Candidatus Dojkabacteria bacterium]